MFHTLILILLFVTSSADVTYHTTTQILSRIQPFCVDPILTCTYHDDILVVDFNKNKEPDMLWSFNEHARERITAEIALYTIEALITHRPTKRITIIPVVNVWGRKQVDTGNVCLRKNQNGVDTNRNYQLFPHPYPPHSEEYEGPHPISEKESKLISSLLLQGVKRYINVHSGEYSMYMPYDSAVTPPPHAERMKRFLLSLHPLCPECVEGSAASVSTYKAYGTSVDYAIRNGVAEAYTFEVYGANTWSCAKMFNPQGVSEYTRVVKMWRRILLTTVEL